MGTGLAVFCAGFYHVLFLEQMPGCRMWAGLAVFCADYLVFSYDQRFLICLPTCPPAHLPALTVPA